MTTKQPDGELSILDDIEKAEAAVTQGPWRATGKDVRRIKT